MIVEDVLGGWPNPLFELYKFLKFLDFRDCSIITIGTFMTEQYSRSHGNISFDPKTGRIASKDYSHPQIWEKGRDLQSYVYAERNKLQNKGGYIVIAIKVFKDGPDPSSYSLFAQKLIETGDNPDTKVIQFDPIKRKEGKYSPLFLSLEELARRWICVEPIL